MLAHWIVDGDPGVDVTGFHIDRLHRYQATREYRRARTVESLGMVYQCHYPNRPMQTARNARLSPLHDRLAAAGAYFREVSGWESPGWYAGAGVEPHVERLSWGRESWFPRWRAEHEAARTNAVLMDMSFMSKFRVEGADAGRFLDRLSANSVDGAPGVITYTPWLNERGTLEADLTVTKLAEGRFWVVATDTAHRHVETWMRRRAGGLEVEIEDVTAAYAQVNLQGPRSREVLATATGADVSNGALPFRAVRCLEVGGVEVLCVRITYVGELGFELYVPSGDAVAVWDALAAAGAPAGIGPAGLAALGSLRMEKAYRDYGHDIDNTDTPYQAGLGAFVDLDKPGGFIGRRAVVAENAAGPPRRRLAQILVTDPEPLLHHAEPVLCDGKPAGYIRAGSYGHTLGGAVGLAMIEAPEPVTGRYLTEARWQVDVAGSRFPAVASLRPLYDPHLRRVRG